MRIKRTELIFGALATLVFIGATFIAIYSLFQWQIVFFQARLPTYPGAQNIVQMYEGGFQHERRVRTFQTSDSSELVHRFYEAQIANMGWYASSEPGQVSSNHLIEYAPSRGQMFDATVSMATKNGTTFVEITESRSNVFVDYFPGLNP